MSTSRDGGGLPTPVALALFGLSLACAPALIAGGLMHGFLAGVMRRSHRGPAGPEPSFQSVTPPPDPMAEAEKLREIARAYEARMGRPLFESAGH